MASGVIRVLVFRLFFLTLSHFGLQATVKECFTGNNEPVSTLAQWKLNVGLCVTRLPERSNPVVNFLLLLLLLLIQTVNPLGCTPFPKRKGF